MNLERMLGSDLSYRIGWTLIRSLWQGSAVAAVLMPLLWLLRNRSPQARYRLASGGLGITLACAIVTFSLTHAPSQPADAAPLRATLPSVGAASGIRSSVAAAPLPDTERAAPAASVGLRDEPSGLGRSIFTSQQQWMPWISRAWVLGMLLLSIWRLGGWIWAQRLKRIGVAPAGPELSAALARMGRRLRVGGSVRAVQSMLVQTPMLVGWLRPVVLMPIAILTNLTPQQVEAILAHELAHVRRHDYLLNLLQVLIETMLFYHPAVWWMSRRIRLEREQCCDEIAVAACGDRCAYAESLAAIEEARLGGAPVLAARGSGGAELLDRVRRLLGRRDDALCRSARGFAAAGIWLATALLALMAPRPVGLAAPATQSIPASAMGPAAFKAAVLLVTPGNYFLERALAQSNLSVVTIRPAEFDAQHERQPAGQLIVFDRFAPQAAPSQPALYVGIVPPESSLAYRDATGRPATINNASIVGWDREHPILRDLDLNKLYVDQALALHAADDWHTLVRGNAGRLILACDRNGIRQMVIGFDVMQSNWPSQLSFPMFLRRSIQWLVHDEPAATTPATDKLRPEAASPAGDPETRPAARFRAECVLSGLADGKRQILASPTLNLEDGSETSFLFTGKPPVVIEQLPCREAGILGTVSVQQQPDGRLRIVCHISRRVARRGEHGQDDDSALLEKSQSLAATQKRLIEARLLAEAARQESDFRHDKSGASTPYTAQEIARVDSAFARKEKDRQALLIDYQYLRDTYGPKYPSVVATKQRLELWQKTIEDDVKKFNQSFLIVEEPDGQPGRIVSKDLSRLWATVEQCRRALDDESAAIKQILRVGGIQTDQTVRAGEPVAVELDDGTRLEVSVHPSPK